MIYTPSPSQVASWYHSQIFRIPHGKQNPTKRYLTDSQVLKLFDGTVRVQEKVDGKMSWDSTKSSVTLVEDMTGKHTIHDHVINYKSLPDDKRILLDYITVKPDFMHPGKSIFKVLPTGLYALDYAVLTLKDPTVGFIHQILELLAQSPSHFGSPCIEGHVIKNYGKQLFGKWINDEFEDQLGA